MELKFKNSNESFKIDLDEVKIKPYLTWEEFSEIYKMVSAQSNSFMKYYCKVVEFAKVCTNIDFDGMEDNKIYDICSELGLPLEFSLNIEEYSEIDRMIDKDESIYNVIKEISDNLTPQINEAMKKIGDGSGLMGKLKDVIGNVNK